MPFTVEVGEQQIDSGNLELWLDDPTVHDRREFDGKFIHTVTTPDRSGRWRWGGDGSAE